MRRAPPCSALGEAIAYAGGLGPGLVLLIDDAEAMPGETAPQLARAALESGGALRLVAADVGLIRLHSPFRALGWMCPQVRAKLVEQGPGRL